MAEEPPIVQNVANVYWGTKEDNVNNKKLILMENDKYLQLCFSFTVFFQPLSGKT